MKGYEWKHRRQRITPPRARVCVHLCVSKLLCASAQSLFQVQWSYCVRGFGLTRWLYWPMDGCFLAHKWFHVLGAKNYSITSLFWAVVVYSLVLIRLLLFVYIFEYLLFTFHIVNKAICMKDSPTKIRTIQWVEIFKCPGEWFSTSWLRD